jgi:integration host factor subunit beta
MVNSCVNSVDYKGAAMNKSELIEAVAERAKVTKKRAEEVVNLIFDSMVHAMVKGDRIEIRGIGSFVVKEYGSYTGRNPRTGESIRVRPKKLPFFKVGKELKELVDKQAGGQQTPSTPPPSGF